MVLAGGASKNPLAATTAPAALSMGKKKGASKSFFFSFFGGNASRLESSCRRLPLPALCPSASSRLPQYC